MPLMHALFGDDSPGVLERYENLYCACMSAQYFLEDVNEKTSLGLRNIHSSLQIMLNQCQITPRLDR